MNSISSWICSSSSKNLFVKIVHHGGHVEIYDRPVLAAELLVQYPNSCVALPTVFRNPHAVVSSAATLVLGQKYYVVPITTIRRLQLKHIASQKQQENIKLPNDQELHKMGQSDHEMVPTSWLTRKSNKKAKNGKKGKDHALQRGDDGKGSARNGGARSTFTSFEHWKPGLESITEE